MKTELTINYSDKLSGTTIHLPVDVFKRPINNKEYAKLEKILDSLIDAVRENENHPLATTMQIIGENLEEYDSKYSSPIGVELSEIAKVSYLMRIHNLKQKDLADIFGGQANVSKFLNGERSLSKTQISGLKKKFGISADYFL